MSTNCSQCKVKEYPCLTYIFLFSTHESVISNQAQSSNTKIIFRAHSHWLINLCWPDGFSQGPLSRQCSNPALWTLFRKVQMSLTTQWFSEGWAWEKSWSYHDRLTWRDCLHFSCYFFLMILNQECFQNEEEGERKILLSIMLKYFNRFSITLSMCKELACKAVELEMKWKRKLLTPEPQWTECAVCRRTWNHIRGLSKHGRLSWSFHPSTLCWINNKKLPIWAPKKRYSQEHG